MLCGFGALYLSTLHFRKETILELSDIHHLADSVFRLLYFDGVRIENQLELGEAENTI